MDGSRSTQGNMRNAYAILFATRESLGIDGSLILKCTYLKEMGCEDIDFIDLAQFNYL